MIIDVLLPLNLSKCFSYKVPNGLAIKIGDFVEVPFLNKKYIGVVWNNKVKLNEKIKYKIIHRKLPIPALKKEIFKFIEEFSLYNLQPIGLVFKLFLYKTGLKSLDKGLKKIRCFKEYKINKVKDVDYNSEQIKAIKNIKNKLNKNIFNVFLLHGVTGSGKTLVYMDIVKDLLKQNKQILILLPEKALSNQISRRFEEFLKAKCAIWHSGIKDKIKKKIWKGILENKIQIVLGARSSMFLPFQDLGLVVIDEEHDSSYKQEEGLIYNARDMIILMASILKFPVILATATPTIETYYNASTNKYNHILISKRYKNKKFPVIKKIKINKNEMSKNKYISDETLIYTKKFLDKQKQVLFFLNRRGFSTYVICYNCNKRFVCPNCNIGLVFHKIEKKLKCHYCDFGCNANRSCTNGKNCELKFYGIGVEKLFDEIKELFPKKKIIFLSSDVSVEDELNSRIKKIEKNEVDIIVATQLISKGFNFPDLNCIVVVNSDNIFFGSDIRSTEKNYQLLHQLSGRAGRFEDNALVILQSYENNNKLVDALSNEDIFKFYKEELNFRKAAYLPPYSKLISFIISGNNKFTVERNSIMIKNLIPKNDHLKIYGPVSAPISKIKSNFRSRILIKYSTKIRPQKLLKETVEKMKNFKNIKVEIDVDPINFM